MHPTMLPYGVINDADSHIMPTRAWLEAHAAPADRALVGSIVPEWEAALLPHQEAAFRQMAAYANREDLFFNALNGPKSGFAPGALDGLERSEVLDALGIGSQLVLSTFVMPELCNSHLEAVTADKIVAAHNRAIRAFCAHDARMVAVGIVSFHNPASALLALQNAIASGLRVIQVPTDAFWGVSPSHEAFEPFWAMCEAHSVAVVAHIGGGQLLPDSYHRTSLHNLGSPRTGGETMRPKDFAAVHHSVERFLTCLVLDGVLDRYSRLRLGIMEHGASWLVSFMRHLDYAARHFRSDRAVAKLTMRPSDILRRQVRVVPFFFEDVGWLAKELGDSILLFSTDYPHFEGGTDPVGRFEASFDAAAVGTEARKRFYVENYRDLITTI